MMNNTMRAMRVEKPGEKMRLVEIPLPEPKADQVLIEVLSCGVCNGDSATIEGKAKEYPRIPGHEVIGYVRGLGLGVSNEWLNQKVGIGFHAGHGKINGQSIAGGFAEYMVAEAESIVQIPKGMQSEYTAPLMCAGETTFSALFNSMARKGELVAIEGIGGLGHLAVQYAKKLGFTTVAISHGSAKEQLIKELGADYFIDSSVTNPVDELKKLGLAKVILSTVPKQKNIKELINGLKEYGQLILVASSKEPLNLSASDLIARRLSVTGAFTSGKELIAQTLSFSNTHHIEPKIQLFPLEKANEAYRAMKESKVQFRAVLQIKSN